MNDFELNTKLKIKSMWICIALYAAGSLLSFFSIALGDVFVFLVGFFVWLFYLFLSEAITVICIVSGVRQTVAAKRHAPISDKPCNVLIPIFSILNMALFVAAFFIFPPTNDSRNGVSSLVVTFIAIQIVYCVFDIIFLLRYRKYRRLCKASASAAAAAAAPTLTSTLAPAPASASTPTSVPASAPAQSQFASTAVQSQPVPSQFAQVPAQSQSQSQFASTPVPPQPYIQAVPQQMPQYQQPISQPMSQQMPQQINCQQQAGASQQIPQYQQPNAIPQAQPVQPQIVPQPVQQPISQPMQQQFPQAPVSPMGAPSSTAGNAPSSFTNGAAGSVDVDFNEDNYSQL